MKIIWCRELEDIVNIARAYGWLFHFESAGAHYYYVYTGVESEVMCVATKSGRPLDGKYVSIDDEGKLKVSDQPIPPSCAKIIDVVRDDNFAELLSKR
jgi:hypothetical protein